MARGKGGGHLGRLGPQDSDMRIHLRPRPARSIFIPRHVVAVSPFSTAVPRVPEQQGAQEPVKVSELNSSPLSFPSMASLYARAKSSPLSRAAAQSHLPRSPPTPTILLFSVFSLRWLYPDASLLSLVIWKH